MTANYDINNLPFDTPLSQSQLLIYGAAMFLVAFISGALLSTWIIIPTTSMAKKIMQFNYSGWKSTNETSNVNVEDLSDIDENKVYLQVKVTNSLIHQNIMLQDPKAHRSDYGR